jgi:hypothetical protein
MSVAQQLIDMCEDETFVISEQFVNDFSQMIHESCEDGVEYGFSYDAWWNFYRVGAHGFRERTSIRELTRVMGDERGVAMWLIDYFNVD